MAAPISPLSPGKFFPPYTRGGSRHLPRIHRHHGERQKGPPARRSNFSPPSSSSIRSTTRRSECFPRARRSISPARWPKSTTSITPTIPCGTSISCVMAVKLHPPASESRALPSCELLNVTTSHRPNRADPRAGRAAAAAPGAARHLRALDLQAPARSALAPGRIAARALQPSRHPRAFARRARSTAAYARGLTSLLLAHLVVLVVGLTNRAFPFVATVAAVLLTALFVPHPQLRPRRPYRHRPAPRRLRAGRFRLGRLPRAQVRRQKGRARLVEFLSARHHRRAALPLLLPRRPQSRRRGGIRVFTGDTMEVWAIDASLRGYYFNTNIGWHVPEWPLVVFMLRSGLPVITLFEITAPLCLAVAALSLDFHARHALVPPAEPRLHEHLLLRRHVALPAAHRLVETVSGAPFIGFIGHR